MDSISLLYPAGYNEKKRSSCKLKDYDFIRELQLDSLVVLITGNYRGMANLKLQDFFTTDEEVLKYRLDVVEDLVEHREWYEVFCKAIPAIQNISDLQRAMSSDFSIESALGSIRFLEMYIEVICPRDSFGGSGFGGAAQTAGKGKGSLGERGIPQLKGRTGKGRDELWFGEKHYVGNQSG